MPNNSLSSVIKFKFNLKMSSPINEEHFLKIEKWRAIFHKMGLIGEYQTTKIDFGNLSKRLLNGEDQFIITGSQTGQYPNLSGMQYCKVTACHLKKLQVEATGPIAPSSDSLIHYAMYEQKQDINYIFHIHNIQLWNFMIKNNYPSIAEDIDQTSLELSNALSSIIQSEDVGIFAIESQEGSIIAYSKMVEDAGRLILDTLKVSKQ